ncbi:MAG TPA: DUF4968 domain-containing protein [Chloroflexi bacterium]|nr:DUF4968 domain-containing protein [Chloroflexota bacterium]
MKTWKKQITYLILGSIVLSGLGLLIPRPVLALDGVWHNPYGIDAYYSSEPTERYPRDPVAGENVYIKATTWPIEWGQAVWVEWQKNGVNQSNVGASWKYNSGNNSYWEANLGSFSQGDVITYTVKANVNGTNEKSVGPFSFTVTDWDYLSQVTGYTDVGNGDYVELDGVDSGGALTPTLGISFPSPDVFRMQVAPTGTTITATSVATYTVITSTSYITITTSALQLSVKKNPYRMTVYDSDGTQVIQEYDSSSFRNIGWLSDGESQIAKIGQHYVTPSSEAFYGFGERFNDYNKRGEDVPIYVFNEYLDQQDRTYMPIPFFISSKGYGIFLDTTYFSIFNLATGSSDRYGFTANAGMRDDAIFDYYFIRDDDPEGIIEKYTDVSGKPTLPPKWAFGLWMSSNAWNKESEVRLEVSRTITYSIPHTAMVIEAWSDEATFYIFNDATYTAVTGGQVLTYTDFTFAGKWPDPKDMVEDLHDQGIRVLLWQIPVEKYMSSPPTQLSNDESYMISQGYAVGNGDGGQYRIPDGYWFGNSLLLDFTNSDAADWWFSKRDYLLDNIGIDGFKTDGGEHLWGRWNTFDDGREGDEMRNAYPGEYVGAYYDYVDDKTGGDAVTFSRAGTAGAQAWPIYWAGDESSTFAAFRASVQAGLNASMSGVPFWTWDLAGFSGDVPSADLYIRAAEMSAFAPIMQYHSETSGDPSPSRDRTPWNIEWRTSDNNVMSDFRKYANIRMNLLPYTYSEAYQTSQTGVPMMRAMMLEYPDDSTAASQIYQYVFGSQLLVAPVVSATTYSKDVYLPEGEWIDIWNGGMHSGSKTVSYYAPRNTIPVFVKAGAIIPANLNADYEFGGNISNSVVTHTNLSFYVYPFGTSTYDWYDDSAGSVKTITSTESYIDNNQLTVSLPAITETATLIIDASEPISVTKDSTTLTERATLSALKSNSEGWYYDSTDQDVYVKVSNGNGIRTITLYGIDRPAYEAEFASLTNTATDTDHTGYTGAGFVDQFETAGDAVTFEVYAPEGATYSLDFRYACAVSGGATRNIYVDDAYLGRLTLPQLANWDTWDVASISTNLTQGKHTIKIAYDSGDNTAAINLDNLGIYWTNNPAREYHDEEGMLGNQYAFAQLDAQGTLYDFMYPLGIYSGIVVDGDDASGTEGVQVNIETAMAGVEVDGRTYWLNEATHWNTAQQYVTDTAIIETIATHTDLDLSVAQYDFIPQGITFPTSTVGIPLRGLYVKRTVITNTGSSALNVSFHYFADLDINGDPDDDEVSYKSAEDAFYFYDGGDSNSGRNRTLAFGLGITTTATVLSSNQYTDTNAGSGHFVRQVSIPAGAAREFDILLTGATSTTLDANLYNSDVKPALTWFQDTDATALQSQTAGDWGDLIDDITTFESPDSTYNDMYKRSIVLSVLAFDKSTGAMSAGFHNGAYAYCWPRDAVYGAMTMDRAGLHDIAEDVYDWLWNTAERDTSTNDIGSDGVYHRYWYQKYTMDGIREWTNPQVDETAVIPTGAWFHYQQTGDSDFADDYYDMVKEAATVSSENNPHQGMDYSESMQLVFAMNIWEDMWGMLLYTNANVAAGLRDAAEFAQVMTDTTSANLFTTRRISITQGITSTCYSTDTTSIGMYDPVRNRFYVSKDLKKWYTDQDSIWNAISTDVSQLGLVVPFDILPANDSRILGLVTELEAALTDVNETHTAYGGVVRYRQDQSSRYGDTYSDFGDTYYDGGPWMMATAWMAEYHLEKAGYYTGTTAVDKAQDYMDYLFSYVGNLGVGAEQIDEYKSSDEFALQAAWGNVWESNGTFVDALLGFVDYTYDAPNDSITVSPKLPSDWNHLGSHIQIKNGDLYVKVTKGASQRLVDLDNNSSNNLSVNIYVQTDAQPTSVTGTSLNWSYDSTTGRVRLYGTLNANTSNDITINF